MANLQPPKSAPKPQPRHRRKLKAVNLDDPNYKVFYLVNALAACFYFFQLVCFTFHKMLFNVNATPMPPPHLKSFCLLVSIHLRPQYMVFRITLLCSIPAQRFQNKPWGAVTRGSSSVNNLRMVLRVQEEMSCCLPILLCTIPLQTHPATLSRFQILQQHLQEIPCPPQIYQQHQPVIQPQKIIQSQKQEIRQLTNSQIGWARRKHHMTWPSARKE